MPLTKAEFWLGFLKQAPKAADPEQIVQLRSRGLKNLIEQAHDEGFAAGKASAEAMQKLKDLGRTGRKSIFEEVFGKKSPF